MAALRPRLFEASWEVCNKVGGIHTVITSKLSEAQADFGDQYVTVGPWLPASQAAFVESDLPESLAPAAQIPGVVAHYGIWTPYGQPTILLDWTGLIPSLNQYKTKYWELFALDTLGADAYDFDPPFAWGIAVGLLAAAFAKQPVILHAHEWLTASALLETHGTPVRTVFTIHATVLGRAISGSGVDLYAHLDRLDAAQEARAHNVVSKHQLERLGATLATSFTAVSRLTATEAAHFFGRNPNVITENGLNTEALPTYDQLCVSRMRVRRMLEEFLAAYLFPCAPFDLATTSLQFTMGRFEPHNKGYDLHLETLGKLNQQLKNQGSDQTIVTFFLVPSGKPRLRPEASSQFSLYRKLRGDIARVARREQRQLYADLCADQDWLPAAVPASLRETVRHMPLPLPPPISPYEIAEDEITRLAAQYGLNNAAEDRVKVLYFPLYLDGFDGIFDLPLYELIPAFDLGVFASKYEPWGYTPMETLALGVPAVTSTLTGFGRSLPEGAPGSFLLDRASADDDSLTILARILLMPLRESPRQWSERRMGAYRTAQAYSWKNLYRNYRTAYASSPPLT